VAQKANNNVKLKRNINEKKYQWNSNNNINEICLNVMWKPAES